MRVRFPPAVVLLASGALSCSGPDLELPAAPKATWSLELGPSDASERVPAVFRGHVQHAPAQGRPWLFRDELSDYYERALRHGEVPSSLAERALPLRFWREGDELWLQPTQWLEAGATYAVALEGTGTLGMAHVSDAATPRWERRFPPGAHAKRRLAMLCGEAGANMPDELALEPAPVALRSAGCGAGCWLLETDQPFEQPLVSEPLVAGALLDPSPWRTDEAAPASVPCARGSSQNGACLEIEDDRVLISAPGDDLLFGLTEPRQAWVVVPAGQRALLLGGLQPETSLRLRGSLFSSGGERLEQDLVLATTAPRRHLILNEVLANPLGPEPDSEWIELINDADRAVSLADVWLEDGGGTAPLPEVELGPREIVLLVNDAFRPSGVDVAAADSVRLLRLAHLGARGLGNSGEALLLVGREGVLSRFPAIAAAHPGFSIARRSPVALDDDPQAFAEHAPPGASPGAPNTFD